MNSHQRNNTFTTRSIDTASYVMVLSGEEPELIFAGPTASFKFPSTIITKDALVSYECGGECEARKLLEIRGQLFRRLKGGRRD